MSKRGFNDIELQEALSLYADAQSAALLKGLADEPQVLSEEGISRGLTKILKDTPISGRYGGRYSSRRIIAAALATLITIFAFTMIASAGIREKVLEQVRSVFGDSVNYDFWSNETGSEEHTELPQLSIEVPEGFELTDEIATAFEYEAWYHNAETNDNIHFMYASLNTDFSYGFSKDIEGRMTVKIHENEADLIPHSNNSSQCNIIWIDDKLNVCILIDTTLSEERLIETARSIYF